VAQGTAAARDEAPVLNSAIAQAKTLSGALPDLLVEAKRVAMTVASGWHGRRQAGSGETFWQFRPFLQGESTSRIDWRRSARDEHLYVREREWEAAHTVWMWSDLSDSMSYRSKLSNTTKRDRAVVLMLALADLLARSGERIGIPAWLSPTAHRQAAERMANALMTIRGASAFPQTHPIRRFSDVVVFGDFIDPLDDIAAVVGSMAGTGARGHLVQIMDPAEETFPFFGRTEFRDPETGQKLTTGRAENWSSAYRAELEAHRDGLRQLTQRAGWSLLIHHTDRSAAEPLLALHARLSVSGSAGAQRGAA
jgi:uncharacterized protein (DUF58 family)